MEPPKRSGYEEPYQYPKPKIIYGIALTVALLTIILLYDQLSPVMSEGILHFLVGFVIIGSISNSVNTEFHERTHYKVGVLLGYEPALNIPWHRQSGSVDFPGQFVDANHNVVSLLSPLTLLSFIYSVVILADFHWSVSLIIAIMFITNAAGSGADIYGAYYDYKLPEGSLVYFPDGEEKVSYIYEPID